MKPIAPLLTLVAAIALAAAATDSSAQISGVDDNIVASNLDGSGFYTLPTISGLGGDLTVEGWVFLRSYADWGRIADLGNGQARDNIGLGTVGTTGRPLFFVEGLGGIEGPNSLGLNTWVHVAGVIQSDRTMRLYVNGNQVATGTASGDAPVVDRTSNYLGESNFAADALLNGGLADVRVWNTARSQAEIQANMPVGSIAGPTTGLVAAYAFGATGATPTADLSGNGYTATQNGNIGYSKFDTGTLATGGFSNAGANVVLNVAEGQLNITGTNSVNRLTVQNGSVTQAAGSAVTTTGAGTDGSEPFQVGLSAGETGSYAMSGGTLEIANAGLAFIGASGTGTMTQTGGAVTTGNWTAIGRFGGSVGNYTIAGGSLNHTSTATRIIVGENGTGTLTIDGSGGVTTAGGISIAHGAGGVGTVNLEGGTLTTPGIAKGAGTTATLNMDGGTIVATRDNSSFMSGLNVAELKAGGGTIDDGGFQIVVGQTLSGAGGLTKTGGGRLTLSGSNTYTGTTTISAGTLQIGSGGGTGSLDSSDIVNNAALVVDRTGTITLSGNMSGTGALTKNGSGTLFLSGTNTYSGDTFVDGGTLAFVTIAQGSASSLGTNGRIVIANGDLSFVGDTTQTVNRNIAWGPGTTGALLANGAAGAALVINDTAADPFYEPGTRTFTFGGTNTDANTYSGVLANQGANPSGLAKTGSGVWIISGNNSYTDQTFINGGMLIAANNNALGVGGVSVGTKTTIASGATLALQGDVSLGEHMHIYGSGVDGLGAIRNLSGTNALTASSYALRSNATLGADAGQLTISGELYEEGGTFGMTKVGAGTVTLSAANTYTGTTTVEAGELALNGSLASSLVSVLAGATLSGTGSIGGDATISGIHSPGNSPGIQTVAGDLAYSAGASVTWELTGNTADPASRGTAFDGIDVGGNLAFNGATSVNLVFNLAESVVDWADEFWSLDRTGTDGWLIFDTAGTTANLVNLSIAGSTWLDAAGNSLATIRPGAAFGLEQVGEDVYLTFVAVPEPSTFVLAGLGFAIAGLAFRRQEKRCQPPNLGKLGRPGARGLD